MLWIWPNQNSCPGQTSQGRRPYLQRAYELRPQDPTIALAYSEALERNHQLPQAREVLETSLKSHPDQFSLRLRLRRVNFRSNDLKSAATQLEAAQLMQPENVEVTVDLAKALVALGNFVDPVEILYDTNVSRKNSKVSELLATACIKLGQQTESTGSINHARTICKSKTPR